MKIKRGKLVREPVFITPAQKWRFIYQQDPPTNLAVVFRAWQVAGLDEDEITQALVIAAQTARVVYDEKMAYMGGVCRQLLARKQSN